MPYSKTFSYYRVGMTGEPKDTSMAFERRLAPNAGRPFDRAISDAENCLDVSVVFTSPPATVSALKRAGVLASKLSARVTLVVAQVVPYPLPLESPPVLLDFSEKRFAEIDQASPVQTIVRLYLCRDLLQTLKTVLRPRSLVVIGGRKHWWPTRERRLARTLRREGHEVILTETE